MSAFIELLSTFAQMVILTYAITKTFGFKDYGRKSIFGFVITCIIKFVEISFLNSIVIYDGFLSSVIILTLIIYARNFLKGKLFQQIFAVLFSTAIVFTISSTVIFLFSYISKVNTEILMSDFTMQRIVILILCRFLEFLVLKFISKLNSEYVLTLKEWILFTSMPLLSWISVILMTQSSMQMHYIQSYMFYIALIMVAINVIIFFFMYKIKQDTETKLEYELLKMQYNNIKQMETNMKALYDSTYSVKHDMEKHLLVLKTLAQKQEYAEIDNYIEKIFDRDLGAIQKIVFTDNDVFNAIINTKLELCRQKHIFPSVTISNEAVSCIKISDIAVLFGNLFDNAIEAVEHASDKVIFLNIQLQGQYVSIYMENSFNAACSNTDLTTSKKDKQEHGFGTKNIKRIIEENDGMIQYFENDSGMFCCDILLKKC